MEIDEFGVEFDEFLEKSDVFTWACDEFDYDSGNLAFLVGSRAQGNRFEGYKLRGEAGIVDDGASIVFISSFFYCRHRNYQVYTTNPND
jgi:hypothetical protein